MTNKLMAGILANASVSITSLLAPIFSEIPTWGSFLISLLTAVMSAVLGWYARKDNLMVKRADAELKRAQARKLHAEAERLENENGGTKQNG